MNGCDVDRSVGIMLFTLAVKAEPDTTSTKSKSRTSLSRRLLLCTSTIEWLRSRGILKWFELWWNGKCCPRSTSYFAVMETIHNSSPLQSMRHAAFHDEAGHRSAPFAAQETSLIGTWKSKDLFCQPRKIQCEGCDIIYIIYTQRYIQYIFCDFMCGFLARRIDYKHEMVSKSWQTHHANFLIGQPHQSQHIHDGKHEQTRQCTTIKTSYKLLCSRNAYNRGGLPFQISMIFASLDWICWVLCVQNARAGHHKKGHGVNVTGWRCKARRCHEEAERRTWDWSSKATWTSRNLESCQLFSNGFAVADIHWILILLPFSFWLFLMRLTPVTPVSHC